MTNCVFSEMQNYFGAEDDANFDFVVTGTRLSSTPKTPALANTPQILFLQHPSRILANEFCRLTKINFTGNRKVHYLSISWTKFTKRGKEVQPGHKQ
jgi:hypothetical protein